MNSSLVHAPARRLGWGRRLPAPDPATRHLSHGPGGPCSSARRLGWGRAALALVAPFAVNAAVGDALVSPGQPAPPFALPALDGQTVELTQLNGRIVLLLFGELYNQNSLAAATELTAILNTPGLAELGAAAYLVVTQKDAPAALRVKAEQLGVALPCLHDQDRRAFAAYGVVVLPSLVVIDGRGRVLMSCAGHPLTFRDLVSDALLLAAGRLSEREVDERRSATTAPTAPARATRLATFARQLARRGSEELAIHNFQEALRVDPHCVAADVGLGTVLARRNELPQAEGHFRRALAANPDSVEAALGLIQIQVRRGGDELAAATELLRELQRKRPNDPGVLYAAAVVAEKTGDVNAALGLYKRAAEEALYGPARVRGAQ